MIINDFSDLALSWQLDPVLLGLLLTTSLSYFLATVWLRQRILKEAKVSWQKLLIFCLAIVMTYLIEASPLHDLGERYLFSAHMTQHLLLTYFAAPLFLLSIPDWLMQSLMRNKILFFLARLFNKAIVAALTYTLFLSLWHFPVIYDAGLRNSSLHHLQHFGFFIVSLIFWWPVMQNVRGIKQLHPLLKIVYLFISSTLLQIPLFGIITFADHAFYPSYVSAPRFFFSSALEDQRVGGVIMKVLAMLFYILPMTIIFVNWYRAYQADHNPGESRG